MPEDSDDTQKSSERDKKPRQRSRFVAEPEEMFFPTEEEAKEWRAQRLGEIQAYRQRILQESAERRKQAAKSQAEQSPLIIRIARSLVQKLNAILGRK